MLPVWPDLLLAGAPAAILDHVTRAAFRNGGADRWEGSAGMKKLKGVREDLTLCERPVAEEGPGKP